MRRYATFGELSDQMAIYAAELDEKHTFGKGVDVAGHRDAATTRCARKSWLPVIIGGVVGLGSLNPAVASADTLGPFIDYLDRNGVDVSTMEVQDTSIELGQAICDLYRTSLRVGSNPNHEAMALLERGHTSDEAAVWVVGSVNYVCPQFVYLLP